MHILLGGDCSTPLWEYRIYTIIPCVYTIDDCHWNGFDDNFLYLCDAGQIGKTLELELKGQN